MTNRGQCLKRGTETVKEVSTRLFEFLLACTTQYMTTAKRQHRNTTTKKHQNSIDRLTDAASAHIIIFTLGIATSLYKVFNLSLNQEPNPSAHYVCFGATEKIQEEQQKREISKSIKAIIEQTCLIMKSIVKKVEGDTANHFQNCTGGWTNRARYLRIG